ncbi:hypothetical protein BDR04DRAFT_1228939 [Suillus decipiens]|nr:hypothetical protein BDR04DRAFT_1228939 [Suillus decipiens]
MVKTALAVAQQWRWGEQKAKLLIDDLKAYNLCRTPFAGGYADGLTWWKSLVVSANRHPPKALAITLLSISPKQANLRSHIQQKAVASGKPTRQRHAYVHTGAQPGIDVDVTAGLEVNFAWAPPLAPQTQNVDDDLAGPESISLDEIDATFALQ